MRLLIVDPVMAVISGKVDTHKDAETRSALMPIKAMAERTGCTVVLVRHFTKAPGPRAAMRGGGSVAFIATARAGLIVVPDPEDPDLRVLAVSKLNLARIPKALRFELVGDQSGVARVEWHGESQATADELVAAADAAKEELLEHLRRVARCGTACPDLIDCVCGALTWRPTRAASCLECEDRAAAANVELLLGDRWVPARIVAWLRPWEMHVEYEVLWRGRSLRVRALVDRDSPDFRWVV